MSDKRFSFSYVLAFLSFLALATWLSVRAYDSMIGQIYYGPLQGFFASAFHISRGNPNETFRTKAAIFYSNATANSFKDPEQYGALVVSWRRMLGEQRIDNDVLDSKRLLGGALNAYNVLVLPLATDLSDDEISAIKDFVSQKGHGLIFSGAAGSLKENGDWREISLAAEIIGGEDIKELPPQEGGVAYLRLDGKNPLSANIPPGLRMGVHTYDRPVSARVLEPRTQTAGYWEADGRTGMASGSYRGGRFVWTGFTLGSAIDPFGVKAGEILTRNMLAYAAFSPIFAKEPWPNGKQAAVVFAEEADDGLKDAAVAAPLFAQKRVPCTFFCAPAAARAAPGIFKTLASNRLFEIGLRATAPSRNQPLEAQLKSLQDGKKALESLGGRGVRGFSPEGALYDKDTLQALLDADYSYLAADEDNSGPPTVIQARKPRLMSIGRSLKLLMEFPHASKESQKLSLAGLERGFEDVYRMGGFYTLSLPAGLLKDPGQARVLSQFLDYVKTKNVWLADFGEVADWSSRWMLVDVDSAKTSETRSNLIVTNSSPGEIASLRLIAHLPDESFVTASSDKLDGSIRVVSRQKEQDVLEIRGLRGEGLVFFIDRDAAEDNAR